MANGSPNIAVATVDVTQPDIVMVMSNIGGTVIGTPSTIDPQLDPLSSNGGPTPTMALAAASAVDSGGSAAGLVTDQRGFPRPSGPAPDLGAYELIVDDTIFRDGFE
jgi:hypothetical protein